MTERQDGRAKVQGVRGQIVPDMQRIEEAICDINGSIEHAKRITAEGARKIDDLRNDWPSIKIGNLTQAYIMLASITETLITARGLVDAASKELVKSD